jgi:hypothetical protein
MSTPAILEGALLAQAAGFAVHYQRGKRAFEPSWSTLPPKIAEELRRDYHDGYIQDGRLVQARPLAGRGAGRRHSQR